MDNGVLHDYKQAFCDEPGASNAHTLKHTHSNRRTKKRKKKKRQERESPALPFGPKHNINITFQISSEILKNI